MDDNVETALAVAQDLNFQLMARHGGIPLEVKIAAIEVLRTSLKNEHDRRITALVLKNYGK